MLSKQHGTRIIRYIALVNGDELINSRKCLSETGKSKHVGCLLVRLSSVQDDGDLLALFYHTYFHHIHMFAWMHTEYMYSPLALIPMTDGTTLQF